MEKTKKVKIFIALFYVSLVLLFLYFFFSKFTLQEITSYDFIKNNRDYFFELRQSNLLILGALFIIFTIVGFLGTLKLAYFQAKQSVSFILIVVGS